MFNPDMFFLQVFGMSTKWEVEQMMDDDRIYLSNNTNEAEDCLVNDDCNQLGRLLSGTGCHQINLNIKSISSCSTRVSRVDIAPSPPYGRIRLGFDSLLCLCHRVVRVERGC